MSAMASPVRHAWLDFIPYRGPRIPARVVVALLASASVSFGAWGLATSFGSSSRSEDLQATHASSEPAMRAGRRAEGPLMLAAGSGTGAADIGDDGSSDAEPGSVVGGEVASALASVREPESSSLPAKPTVPSRAAPLPLGEVALARAMRARRGLRAALSEGRVHESRNLFVTVAELEGMQWETAHELCSLLTIDGVDGWRLPTSTQLRDVRSARGVPAGTYWSRTISSRDPESAYVYDTDTRRSGLYLKMEPTASTICVQPRPR